MRQKEERAEIRNMPDWPRPLPQHHSNWRLQRHSLPEGRWPGFSSPTHQKHLLFMLLPWHTDRWLWQPGGSGHREWLCDARQHRKRLPQLWPQWPQPRASWHPRLLRQQFGPLRKEGLDWQQSGSHWPPRVLWQESRSSYNKEWALWQQCVWGPWIVWWRYQRRGWPLRSKIEVWKSHSKGWPLSDIHHHRQGRHLPNQPRNIWKPKILPSQSGLLQKRPESWWQREILQWTRMDQQRKLLILLCVRQCMCDWEQGWDFCLHPNLIEVNEILSVVTLK